MNCEYEREYSLQLPSPHCSDVTDMEARDGEDSVCPVSVAVYQEHCCKCSFFGRETTRIDGEGMSLKEDNV